MSNSKNTSIEIYQPEGDLPAVEVRLDKETVWLTQEQMAVLFESSRVNVTEHIQHIYQEKELSRDSTCRKFRRVQLEGTRRVKRDIDHFNLDMIISVGYRIKSNRATQFRIWATRVLRDHLVKGYTINEQRLRLQAQKYHELKNSVRLLENVLSLDEITQEQARGLLEVVTDYSYALDILDQYDFKSLTLKKTTKEEYFVLDYNECIVLIQHLKSHYGGSDLFGVEKDDSFKSSIATIYQSVGGKDAYPSVEEKAANLLYFIVKNHSFVDGNKRIAATLFIYFLNQNRILYRKDGSKRLPDTTLIALTLLIAQSKPEEKDTIIKVIVNLINRNID
jgi:prophage maintenance system killer protein